MIMRIVSAEANVSVTSKRKSDRTTHIQRQRLRTIRALIPIDPHERLTTLEEPRLQTDHNELHTRTLFWR